MRVVIDTNVWIAAVLNPKGRPASLVAIALLRQRQIDLVLSPALLQELAETLRRLYRRHGAGLTPAAADRFVDELERIAEVVPVPGDLRVGRDPGDAMVVETAVCGYADAVVTGDHDLLDDQEVRQYLADHGIAVLTVAEGLARLEGRQA